MSSARFAYSLLILIVMVFAANPTAAQSGGQPRLERVIHTTDDATIHIHLSVPRGQSIAEATLTGGDEAVTLTVAGQPLPVQQWLLLDTGESMVSYGATVQSAIQDRFLLNLQPDTLTSVVLFNERLNTLEGVSDAEDVRDWLNRYYTVRANTPSCIYDALDWVNNNAVNVDRADRVLLVTSRLSRQSPCSQQSINGLTLPVDIVVTHRDIDQAFHEIAETSGGQVTRAQIQQVNNRLQEVRVRWSNPVYRLSAPSINSPAGMTLEVVLNNGTRHSVAIREQDVVALERADTAETSGLMILQNVENTPIPALSAPPAPDEPPAVAQLPPPADEPQTIITIDGDAPPAVADNPAPESADQADSAPADAQQPAAPAQSVAPPEQSAIVQPPAEVAASASPLDDVVAFLDDLGLPVPAEALIGGGAFLLLGFLFLIVRVSTGKRRQPEAAPVNMYTVPETGDYAGGGYSASDNTVLEERDDGLYTFVEPVDTPNSDVTLFDDDDGGDAMTMFFSEDDIQAAIKPDVVGLLQHEGTPFTYEVLRTATTLGRDTGCDIVLEDQRVSRRHVQFITRQTITTMNILTGNPVLVNGVRVQDKHQLEDGDLIQLTPDMQMTFTYTDQQNGDA